MTNAVLENIWTRQSTREFSEQKIPEELLEKIACAGSRAPSGMNRQTWKFFILNDKAKIQTLAEAIGKALNRSGYDFYRPTALIIPTNERESPFGQDDNACALQNIFLAAHSLGVGSVWINQLRDACDNAEVRALLTAFGIPETHTVYGIAALGFPAKQSEPKPRKEVVEFIR